MSILIGLFVISLIQQNLFQIFGQTRKNMKINEKALFQAWKMHRFNRKSKRNSRKKKLKAKRAYIYHPAARSFVYFELNIEQNRYTNQINLIEFIKFFESSWSTKTREVKRAWLTVSWNRTAAQHSEWSLLFHVLVHLIFLHSISTSILIRFSFVPHLLPLLRLAFRTTIENARFDYNSKISNKSHDIGAVSIYITY